MTTSIIKRAMKAGMSLLLAGTTVLGGSIVDASPAEAASQPGVHACFQYAPGKRMTSGTATLYRWNGYEFRAERNYPLKSNGCVLFPNTRGFTWYMVGVRQTVGQCMPVTYLVYGVSPYKQSTAHGSTFLGWTTVTAKEICRGDDPRSVFF